MYFFLSIIMLDIPTACSNDKVLSAQSRCQLKNRSSLLIISLMISHRGLKEVMIILMRT